MSSEPPWVKYQKKVEPPPWEKYAKAKAESPRDPNAGDPTRRASQSFLTNLMENAGEMYTTESEGLPAQAAGGITAAGMLAPMALPAALPAGAARVLLDPKVSGAMMGGYEFLRSGDPQRALLVGAAGAGASTGAGALIKGAGKYFAKRVLTREAAEAAMRAKAAADQAAKLRTTTVPPAAGGATATGTTAPNVVQFPASPQRAAIAMRAPAPVVQPAVPPQGAPAPAAFPKNPAEAAARMRAPKARAPKAEPESSTLEEQLSASVKMSKGARKQLGAAQALEARIVDLRTRQGLSEAQIVAALKEGFGIREPGAAKQIVDMVFRGHGLKQ